MGNFRLAGIGLGVAAEELGVQADQLLARQAGASAQRLIDVGDDAIEIGDGDRVLDLVHHQRLHLQTGFHQLAFADVAHGQVEMAHPVQLDDMHVDIDREAVAVPAHMLALITELAGGESILAALVELGLAVQRQQNEQRLAKQFLLAVAVHQLDPLVDFENDRVVVKQQDAVDGVVRQRVVAPLQHPALDFFSEQLRVLAVALCLPPMTEEQTAQQHQQAGAQRRNQRQPGDRRIDFGLILLGDQYPVAAGNVAAERQHGMAAKIDRAAQQTVLVAQQPVADLTRLRIQQPSLGFATVAAAVKDFGLRAIPAHQNCLAGFARRRPAVELPEQAGLCGHPDKHGAHHRRIRARALNQRRDHAQHGFPVFLAVLVKIDQHGLTQAHGFQGIGLVLGHDRIEMIAIAVNPRRIEQADTVIAETGLERIESGADFFHSRRVLVAAGGPGRKMIGNLAALAEECAGLARLAQPEADLFDAEFADGPDLRFGVGARLITLVLVGGIADQRQPQHGSQKGQQHRPWRGLRFLRRMDGLGLDHHRLLLQLNRARRRRWRAAWPPAATLRARPAI